MGILENLTDDQLALLGCGVAFFAFGGLMAISHFASSAGKSSQAPQETSQTPADAPIAIASQEETRSDRKAA